MTKARRRGADTAAPQAVGDTTAANVDRHRIAARAYEKFLQRGGEPGRDLDDWLEAERELVQPGGSREQGSEPAA
jgi:DUF2934 family protein